MGEQAVIRPLDQGLGAAPPTAAQRVRAKDADKRKARPSPMR